MLFNYYTTKRALAKTIFAGFAILVLLLGFSVASFDFNAFAEHHEERDTDERIRDEAKERAEEKRDEAKERAEEKRDEAKERAEEKRDEAKERAEEKRDEAKERAEEKRDEAKERAEERKDAAKDKIEERKELAREKLEERKQAARDKVEERKELAREKLEERKQAARDKVEEKREDVKQRLESLTDEEIEERKQAAREKLEEKRAEAKERAADKRAELHDRASDKREDLKERAADKRAELHDRASDKREDLKERAADKRAELKDRVEEKRAELRDKTQEERQELRIKALENRDELKDKVQDRKDKIKDEIKDRAVDRAKAIFKSKIINEKLDELGVDNFRELAQEHKDKLKEKAAAHFANIRDNIRSDGLVDQVEDGSYYGVYEEIDEQEIINYVYTFHGTATSASDETNVKDVTGSVNMELVSLGDNNAKLRVIGGAVSVTNVGTDDAANEYDVSFGRARAVFENNIFQVTLNTEDNSGKHDSFVMHTETEGVFPLEVGDVMDVHAVKVRSQGSGSWVLDFGGTLAVDDVVPIEVLTDVVAVESIETTDVIEEATDEYLDDIDVSLEDILTEEELSDLTDEEIEEIEQELEAEIIAEIEEEIAEELEISE